MEQYNIFFLSVLRVPFRSPQPLMSWLRSWLSGLFLRVGASTFGLHFSMSLVRLIGRVCVKGSNDFITEV